MLSLYKISSRSCPPKFRNKIGFFCFLISILFFLVSIPFNDTFAQACTPTSNNALPSVTPSNLKCTGVKNGYLTINFFQSPSNANGGTFPYNYEWHLKTATGTLLAKGSASDSGVAVTGMAVAPGITFANGKMSNLDSGTYVLVTCDAMGNQFQFNTSQITAPGSVFSFQSNTFTNPLCSLGTTGTATAVLTGGSPPYSYSWNTAPVQKTATATNLKAGFYTLTAKDFNNCLIQHTYQLIDPPGLTASISAQTNACAGFNNGTATVFASGGTPGAGYTYSWNTTPVQTSIKATGLTASPPNYTVTVTDANNCTATASATITSVPNPIVTVANPTNPSDCGFSNGSATLNPASSGTPPTYTYAWTRSSPTQANPTVSANGLNGTGLSIGNYNITVTDGNGCTGNTVATIGFTKPPTLTTSPDTTICNGSSAPLRVTVNPANPASGAYQYSWAMPAASSLSNNAIANPIATPTSFTSYDVTLTDPNTTCTSTATIKVSVNPIPVVTPTATPNTVCANGVSSLSAVSTINPATFTWTSPAGPIGTSPPSINVTPSSPTTYTVVGTANGCKSAPVSTTVTVNPLPVVSVTPASTTICAGFSVNLLASGAASYTWAPSPDLSSTTTKATTATPAGAGLFTYTVTGTDNKGCKNTASASVTVNPLPVLTINAPVNPTICKGNSATLTASGASSYNWAPGPGLHSNGYVVSPLSTAIYTVTGTSAAGCVASLNDTVNVINSLPIAITHTGKDPLCFGTADTLTASGATTYSWTAPISATGQTQIVNPTTTPQTTYTVIGTTGACTTSKTITINVAAAINITATSARNPICSGDTTLLTASGATTYSWGPFPTSGNQATIVVTPSSPSSTYTVTGTTGLCSASKQVTVNVNPIPTISLTASPSTTTCVNTPVTLTAFGTAPTYTWSPSLPPLGDLNVSSSVSGGKVICTPSTARNVTYTVTGTKAGCSSQSTITITSTTNSNPLTLNPINPAFCISSLSKTVPFSVSASSGGPLMAGSTYNWTFGGCAVPGSSTASGPSVNYPASCSAGAQAVSVSVMDASNNCVSNLATSVQIDAAVAAVTASTSKPSICNGGSVTLTATGGAGATLYSWTPAASITAPASGAGLTSVTATPNIGTTYTVTASNGSCSTSATVPVAVTIGVTAFAGNPQTVCSGGLVSLGGVNPTPTGSGGGGGYTYSWSATSGTAIGAIATPTDNPINLGAAPITITYTVTVKDINGCIGTSSVDVIVNPSVNAFTVGNTSICSGQTKGLGGSPVTASGGKTPYTYSWSPGSGILPGSTTIANPIANPNTTTTYTVVVTDANNCTANASMTLTVNTSPTVVAGNNSFACNGVATTLNPTVSPAGPAYTYAWSGVPSAAPMPSTAQNPVVSPTSTTTYTLIAKDPATGCTGTSSFTITVNPAIVVNPGLDQPACFGANTILGGAPTASGGTPNYTYSWVASVGTNPSSTANPTVSPTATTKYTLTVTDASSAFCAVTKSVTVTVSPAFVKSVNSMTPANCLKSDGALSINTSGGIAPLTYAWTPNVVFTTNPTSTSANNIAAGTYKIVITDAVGCKDSISAAVNNINPPTATIAPPTNVLCNGAATGSATITASLGTPGYTYSWNTAPAAQTTATAVNLPAGNYIGLVTDSKGCIGSASVTITQPPAITLSTSSTPITCNGGTNGTATVSPSGGNPGYTYLWAPVPTAGQSTATASALTAQTYTVKVTDVNSCQVSASITVNAPAAMTSSFTQVDVDCKGNSTGSATVTVSGGTGALTYAWSPSGGNSPIASGLAAGSYTVTITDTKACVIKPVVTILQPANTLSVSASATLASCGLSDGTATATPAGGTGPYSYKWNKVVQLTQTAKNLPSGIYTVTVTDANNCTASTTVTVNSVVKTLVTVTKNNDVSCFGGADGSATAVATTGAAPYTFSWDGQPGTISGSIATLTAGTHKVIVTDNNLCSTLGTDSVVITQPAVIVLTASTTPNSCSAANGSATVVVSGGGTAPYTYSWNSVPTQTNATAVGLPAGTYTVSVTDAKGCTLTKTAVVSPGTLLSASNVSTNVTCFGGSDGSGTVTATGGFGSYTYSWSPSGGTTATVSNLSANTYVVTVKDGSTPACTTSTNVTITQPSKVSFASSLTPPSSCAAADAKATITPSGANGGFMHAWNPPVGQTNPTITNLKSGTPYKDVVTDSKGCKDSITVIIPNLTGPSPVTIDSTKNVSCSGGCNGRAAASATGIAPLTYSWTGSGQTSPTVTNLCAGPTTLAVTDKNGCTSTVSTVIGGPTAVSVSISATNVACFGTASASATATVTGGNGPYVYKWTNSLGATIGGGLTVNNLSVGTYTINATDASGCTGTKNITITGPATALTSSITSQKNLVCKGACNIGTATVSGNGGTGPYTYSWNTSPAQLSATATNLCAGTYIATVTDAAGCITTSTTTITEPAGLTITNTKTDPSCNASNGKIDLTITGGTSPYAVNWNPANTGPSISNLAAGVYTATVTDAASCPQTYIVTLSNVNGPTVTTTSTNPKCVGSATGTATATATGASPPFSYVWNSIPAQTTAVATGLKAGIYTVSVTDNLGCINPSTTATIIDPPPVTIIATTTPVSCNGSTDGTATAVASGGAGPYTYNWSQGAVKAAVSGLSSGNYTVTATDANGCNSAAKTVSLTNPTLIAISKNITTVTCNGGSNGAITATVTGGSAPYSYNWSPKGGNSATAANLTAGKYFITVTDANGCTMKDSAIVSAPAFLLVTGTAISNPSCNGICDGIASVNGSGGTGPYTYSWNSPIVQTTQQVKGLCAGTYTVTLTDANFCFDTAKVIMTAPAPLNIVLSSANAACGKSDGSITATVSGGIKPYSYSWIPLPGTGSTTATFSAIPAGAYTVKVTDSKNCTASQNGGVNNPPPAPVVSVQSTTNASCKGTCDGSATVLATGNGPITYTWSLPVPASTTSATASNLCAGAYTVTATDVNKCIGTKTLTITDPAILSVSTTITNVTCNGAGDGTSTATPSGGVAPFTYSWNTKPLTQTGNKATGLAPGTYTVTVTDANGCISTALATITEPAPINITLKANSTLACNGDCNGSITASFTGGIGPFTTSWNTKPVQNSLTASALCAGSYTITITDSKGCQNVAKQTMSQPKTISLSVTAINASCKTANGSVKAVVDSGGVAPFMYKWNTGDTSSAVKNLPSASYTVTVTDVNKCSKSATTNISDTQGPAVIVTKTNPSCAKGNDGTATATGKLPGKYVYNWSTTPSKDTATAINLKAGVYTVTVTDAFGCKTVAPDTLLDPPPINVFTITKNVSCSGGADGTATATATNGSAPYVYNWSNLATGPKVNNLSAGTYTVNVSDASKCNGTATILITAPSLLTISLSQTNISCAGGNDGTATATVANGTGPYSYVWSPSGGNGASAFGLIAGLKYTVTATDAKGCTISGSVLLTEPQPIAISFNAPVPITCSNKCDGSLAVIASGGSGIYTYSWNTTPVQTTPTIKNLCSGTYTVSVSDKAGCISKGTTVIADPQPLTLTTSSTPAKCALSDGTATVTVKGGTPGYKYLWNNNQQTATAIGLGANAYTVTVTDTNGCTTTTGAAVSNPNGPVVSLVSSTNASCNAVCDGTATISASGPNSPFTYKWSNVQKSTTPNATNLCAGSQVVTVLDNANCVTSFPVVIAEPAPIKVTLNGTDITCNGGNNGTVSSNVTGGTTPYSYSWSNGGGTSATASNLKSGTYILTVTDAKKCSQVSAPITISEPAAIVARLTVNGFLKCYKDCNNSITATIKGGTSPFKYVWNTNPIQFTSTATALCAGTYNLTITDANGCIVNPSVSITQPAPILLSLSHTDIACNSGTGTATVKVVAPVSGAPFTYLWNSSDTSSTIKNKPAGNYSVTVQNSFGCKKDTSVGINNLTGPKISSIAGTNANCIATCNGSATVTTTAGSGTLPFRFDWNDPASQTTPTASLLCAGTYAVTITDAKACIAVSAPVSISVPSLIVSANPTVGCQGSIVTLTGLAPAFGTISWKSTGGGTFVPPGTINSIYTTKNAGKDSVQLVYNSAGCPPYTKLFTIDVKAKPLAKPFLPAGTHCQGLPVSLAGSTSTPDKITWTAKNTLGLPTGSFSNVNAVAPTYTPTAIESGSTILTMNVDNGICPAQAPVTIVWAPNASVVPDTLKTICKKDVVLLNPQLLGGATGITWSSSGDGVFTPSNTTINATYIPGTKDTTSGNTITLSIAPSGGCNAKNASTPVSIKPLPTVTAGSDQTIPLGQNATLKGSITGASNPVWTTTGCGTFSPNNVSLNPTYIPCEGDQHKDSIRMTLTTTNGCRKVFKSSILHIRLVNYVDVITPYPLTPGLNDVFYLPGLPDNAHIEIIDRWGLKVFESKNYKNDWDGEGSPEGTYFYTVEIKGAQPYHGSVTIIRSQ
jgi:hypothetical protein